MLLSDTELNVALNEVKFQWAPTLGGECYTGGALPVLSLFGSFNGHPPLGVNATIWFYADDAAVDNVSMGTHPWG